MKSIYIVFEDLNASGGVRILTEIGNIASDAGANVTFVYPNYGSKKYYNISNNVKIYEVKTHFIFRRLQYFFTMYFFGLSRDGIVITSSYRLMKMFDRKNIELIQVVQGMDQISLIELSNTFFLGRWINSLLLYIAERISCIRVYVSEYLQKNKSQTGIVIKNYVDPVFFNYDNKTRQIVKDKITIGFVGSSSHNKGCDLFLDLKNYLHANKLKNINKINLVCATNDIQIIENDLLRGIKIVSPKTDIEMADFYDSCDIILSLSINEGFGLPVLEAMSMNCAVIATKSGGVEDFLVHKSNGLLLEDRNVATLFSAIKELIENDDLRHKISSKALLTAQQYSHSDFKLSYLKLFSSLGAL